MPRLISFVLTCLRCQPREESENYKMKNSCPQRDSNPLPLVYKSGALTDWIRCISVKVKAHPWVMDNNCLKYYINPTLQWGVMAWTRIFGIYAVTLEIWPCVKVMTHPWVQYLCEITWRLGVMVRTRIFSMSVQWHWHKRYDLESRSWHTFGSVCEMLSRSIFEVRSYGPDTDFFRYTVTLTLGDMTLIQCHDTPLCHGQQLWNFIQIQLGSEELWHCHWFWVCVHCDLDLWDMTHPLVMDNCVKYYVPGP